MKKITVPTALAIISISAMIIWLGTGMLGNFDSAGQVEDIVVENYVLAQRQRKQFENSIAADSGAKQILFGDLHVHTTFSYDAFIQNLPLLGGSGAHSPADACDFARYCSSLDFWGSTEHAEDLTPYHWRELRKSIKQCNAVADPKNPDVVAFMGWEWSQAGSTPDTHYGHKNVILKDPVGPSTPNRPIASVITGSGIEKPSQAGLALLSYRQDEPRYLDWAKYIYESVIAECAADLPADVATADCREYAATPKELFAKLDNWDQAALVIPHGTSWGIYTPPGSNWQKQLVGHDPDREKLIEIFSGHGNTEEYFDNAAIMFDGDGQPICPPQTPQYTPSCRRAGQIVYNRCTALNFKDTQCQQRELKAQQNYLAAGNGGHLVLEDANSDEWLEAGQCRDCFLPAFNYRSNSSVQAILATRGKVDSNGKRKQFKFGFIASSDNHQAKPGSGYKEFGLGHMTEGRKGAQKDIDSPFSSKQAVSFSLALESTPVSLTEVNTAGVNAFETKRVGSFFYTGGLVAAHSSGRDRDSIWQALQDKEVYATSGPRILLWFNLLDETGINTATMGQSVSQSEAPIFSAKAIGSFKQKPGCPPIAENALGEKRMNELCMGECYNPSDQRRIISRFEVIRILPQNYQGESLAPLIQDPWLVHQCAPNEQGCSIEFSDSEYNAIARDAAYYVRAIEEPIDTVNGAQQQCDNDSNGQCLTIIDCGQRGEAGDDCLAPVEHRAWSSPIFVDFKAG
jgi:hypothetical protein